MRRICRNVLTALSCIALLFGGAASALADVTLPEGTVSGLPEGLTVLDSDGNSVSSEGEYFFLVENMTPLETYTKTIQIMNLREDAAYHIYFYAEPVDKSGEIDLEAETTAVFSLNGEVIFTGSVTGLSEDGSIDLSETAIDLGYYEPGDASVLSCSVTWSGESVEQSVDYGSRLVDADGIHVVRDADGNTYISGEVTFRWIFYAVVDEDYTPPNTGIFGMGEGIYILIVLIIAILILCMLILLKRRKRATAESFNGGEE